MPECFQRALVARLSPPNGCEGPAGALLVPAPPFGLEKSASDAAPHSFVSLPDRRPNRYGWVAELPEPITAEGLRMLDSESLGGQCTLPDVDWYEQHLRAVSRIDPGKPMAVGWRVIRLPQTVRRELITHRVIFGAP